MKLIVGLGNPGKEYVNTRHNTGFQAVDFLAEKFEGNWQEKSKLLGSLSQITLSSQPVLLLKPTTFYNDSGQSARAVKDFYKLDNSDILVIHDELALPFGTIRARIGGSDAGNNGVKSLNAHLGEDYARIRVGVWHELRDRIEDTDFVLSRFNQSEKESFAEIFKIIEKITADFVADIFESTSYKLDN